MRQPAQRPGLGFLGGFNEADRGPRVQQGTQYFDYTNLSRGLPQLTDESAAPDAGVIAVPAEQFGYGGGDAARESGLTDADQASQIATGERDAVLASGFKALAGLVTPGLVGPSFAPVVGKIQDAAIDFAINPTGFSLFGPHAPGVDVADATARSAVAEGMSRDAAASLGIAAREATIGYDDPLSLAENDRALANAVAEMNAQAQIGEMQAADAARAAEAAATDANSSRGLSPGQYGHQRADGGFDDGGYGGYAGDRGPGGSSGDGSDVGAGPAGPGTGSNDGDNGGGGGSPDGGGDSSDGGGGDSSDGGWADGGIVDQEGPVGLSVPGYMNGGMPGQPMLAMGFMDGGTMGAQPNPDQINAQVNQMLRNPQIMQTVVAGAQQLMQTGQLTPEEVMTLGRVAEAAMFNPALYPQLRQFVMSQGMTPLPPSYDPSVIVKILVVARALGGGAGAAPAGPGTGEQPGMAMAQQGGAPGATPPGQVPPTSQAQMVPPNGMRDGGMLHGPGHGRSDSIGTVNESTGQPVKVANGEYIIPEHVVRAKGRDFFDNLLRRYAHVPKEGE